MPKLNRKRGVERDETGRVVHVQLDEAVSADSPLAVQGHEDPRVLGPRAQIHAIADALEAELAESEEQE